jgi:hypothetical protein
VLADHYLRHRGQIGEKAGEYAGAGPAWPFERL